jgi:hypothetical protein
MTASAEIAIVIAAYNRPDALARLLDSLSRADYSGGPRVPLVISIDRGGGGAVQQVAESFEWPHGEKRVAVQPEFAGLRRHILFCGGLTGEFGNVIVLEDDLYVSPFFYQYARQALAFYRDDEHIAGVSLYAYDYEEVAQLPFVPLDDGYDNYFMQVPSSWGQLWTRRQWAGFAAFHDGAGAAPHARDPLSDFIIGWPDSSWKKYFYKYLQATHRYFVFPRLSHTTNFGDSGTHILSSTQSYHVNLSLGARALRFSPLDDSLAKYDAYLEIRPATLQRLNPALAGHDFSCDLYGAKSLHKISTPYLLSAKDCAHPVKSFPASMIPHELNAGLDLPGDYFHLAPTGQFGPMDPAKRTRHSYFSKIPHVNVSGIRSVAFNEGVDAARKSASYRLGDALLKPAKLARALARRRREP